jgi:ATP-dependent DNA helicase RecG
MEHLGTDLIVLGVRRFDLPKIPEVVVREALANALAHRSYEASGTPVRVELRPGTVAIISPGPLPEPVTVSNLREASAARNLDVIRVLRRYALAEDAGRGIDVMQDTMRREMLDPPEFRDTGHSVEVMLPARSAVAPIERAWIRELETRGELTGDDRLILVHAARGQTLTNATVRRLLHVDANTARNALKRLCDQALLRQDGQRGGATYHLVESLRPPAGLRLPPDDLADLIERLAADRPITNTDVRGATGLDRTESLAVLDRLLTEGRLVRTGTRRGTRYHRPR